MRGHIAGRRQRHPLRQMRPGAVGLPDDQEVLAAVPGSAQHLDLMTRSGMERIVDANQLYKLFAGSM
jgi:hypothetical protein